MTNRFVSRRIMVRDEHCEISMESGINLNTKQKIIYIYIRDGSN